MIPQPTILEEPPVPVGLRTENQSQQHFPSISLTLPTKAEKNDNQKASLPLISSDDTGATLSQQEELSVRGREQRHLLMQKLNQRLMESRVCILRNMVGADEVDEDLEKEITGKIADSSIFLIRLIWTTMFFRGMFEVWHSRQGCNLHRKGE